MQYAHTETWLTFLRIEDFLKKKTVSMKSIHDL